MIEKMHRRDACATKNISFKSNRKYKPMRPSWDEYFMLIAKLVSTRSTCNSRPTGAVLVKDRQILATGYNGSMPGAPHCSDQVMADGSPYCHRRALNIADVDKYNYCRASHAEANAIAQAARYGVAIEEGVDALRHLAALFRVPQAVGHGPDQGDLLRTGLRIRRCAPG